MTNKLQEIFVKNSGGIVAADTTSGPESVLSNKFASTYIPAPIKIPAVSFHVKSNGDLEWYTESQQNTVELIATKALANDLLRDSDPEDMDRYIKETLASELARQILDEDLIVIQVNDDEVKDNTVFRAKLKCIQE